MIDTGSDLPPAIIPGSSVRIGGRSAELVRYPVRIQASLLIWLKVVKQARESLGFFVKQENFGGCLRNVNLPDEIVITSPSKIAEMICISK
jgi:hypothetical protein